MEKVKFIFKFIPSSYIKILLQIVVKLKIKKCWPNSLANGKLPLQTTNKYFSLPHSATCCPFKSLKKSTLL